MAGLELAGKVAVVTGASRGIGRAIALELAAAGCDVAFNYLSNADAARALASEIERAGRRALPVKADVADWEAVQAFFARIREELGDPYALVNNAGITRDRALMGMKPEDWQAVIDTNLTGAFHCARAAVTGLMRQRAGRVVNITSVSGLIGLPGQVNYSASKAGLVGLTKALAKEVARYGVTVNAVAPGFIRTDMTEGLSGKLKEEMTARIPLGCFGDPQDVAKAVRFLACEDARYITGQVLTVDGGLAI